jgi:Pyruvate/2-oxoacid:ferredoxin oxidoreductase gamma subunit
MAEEARVLLRHQKFLPMLLPEPDNSVPVFPWLKPGGMMLLNDSADTLSVSHENLKKVGIIDANKIALEEIGLPIPNTVIAGAFAKMSGLLDIEPCCEALQDYFSGKKLAANIVCTKRGFEEVKIYEM